MWLVRQRYVRKLREVADDLVRPQFRHRLFTVAEIDRNDRNAGGTRGANVGAGIAHHDRALHDAAGDRDGSAQHVRIGLLNAECILSADCREAVSEPECVEQQTRESFQLVGAHGEAETVGCKQVERSVNPGKGRERLTMCAE
jgi:hypothetical protein